MDVFHPSMTALQARSAQPYLRTRRVPTSRLHQRLLK